MIGGAWLCLGSPLAGAALITLLGTRVPRTAAAWISTTSVFVAFGGSSSSSLRATSSGAADGAIACGGSTSLPAGPRPGLPDVFVCWTVWVSSCASTDALPPQQAVSMRANCG